jgi:hypothetical protein
VGYRSSIPCIQLIWQSIRSTPRSILVLPSHPSRSLSYILDQPPLGLLWRPIHADRGGEGKGGDSWECIPLNEQVCRHHANDSADVPGHIKSTTTIVSTRYLVLRICRPPFTQSPAAQSLYVVHIREWGSDVREGLACRKPGRSKICRVLPHADHVRKVCGSSTEQSSQCHALGRFACHHP